MDKNFNLKKFFVGLYFLSLAIYLVVGLQPVGATKHQINGRLNIPAINLSSDVTTLEVENGRLETPDTIVGSFARFTNRTLLIGHYSTIFNNLHHLKLRDLIHYNQTSYQVTKIDILEKSAISMQGLLQPTSDNTIVMMTCAGRDLGGGDFTHRLIIEASAI